MRTRITTCIKARVINPACCLCAHYRPGRRVPAERLAWHGLHADLRGVVRVVEGDGHGAGAGLEAEGARHGARGKQLEVRGRGRALVRAWGAVAGRAHGVGDGR